VSERGSRTEDRAIPGWLAWSAGLASLAGAGLLVGATGGGRTGVTGAILLLVAALGFLAVALGQGLYGPEHEGRLDLSARIGAGLLGGTLGGLAYLVTAWLLQACGLPALLGSTWEVSAGPASLAVRTSLGALWGLVFGIVFPRVPGRGAVRRGLNFAVLPAVVTLAVIFPVLGHGTFGLDLGALTFVPVLLYHGAWGLSAGAVVRWARETSVGPVSRMLGA
jgi:hypothetical protein